MVLYNLIRGDVARKASNTANNQTQEDDAYELVYEQEATGCIARRRDISETNCQDSLNIVSVTNLIT